MFANNVIIVLHHKSAFCGVKKSQIFVQIWLKIILQFFDQLRYIVSMIQECRNVILTKILP